MGTIQNHAEKGHTRSMLGETIFDISNGDGYFETPGEALAIRVFRPLEEELKNSCTKVCIANHIFREEAALVAKRALMCVQKTLRDVQLVHFVSRKPVDEALEVMSIFSSALEGCMLRSLTLELGKSGEKGVKAFAALLKSQKTLEKLELVWSDISGEADRAIFELLPSFEMIKSLHFIGTNSGDDVAQTISELVKKCIALEDFDFSRNRIGIQGAMSLMEVLGRGCSLKMLCLEGNMFGKEGRVSLSKVISGHLGLRKVNLSRMNLQDKGVIAIARSLKITAPSLRVPDVGGNHITTKAALALAECLAVKNMLTGFYARNNKLKDKGSIAICKAILEGHEQLKELDLNANAMTIIGDKATVEAVANKLNFSWLFIKANSITLNEIETVKDVLRKGTKGEYVLSRKSTKELDNKGRDSDDIMELYQDGEGLTDSDTKSEEKLSHEDL